MGKYKDERYIEQRYNETAGTWTFRVRYKGTSKSFKETDYGDPRVAFKKALMFRNDLMAGNFAPLSVHSVSIRQIFEDSLELKPTREETKRKLRGMFNNYINADFSISQLTKEFIITTLNNMIETCTDDTIKRVHSIWRRIISTAIIKEYINKDLMVGITAPASHCFGRFKTQKQTDRQTLDEVINLAATRLKSNHDRLQVPLMLEFLYNTGCRPCEMFALNKDDVADGFISINKEMGSNRQSNNVVRQCKTKSSVRRIPITKQVQQIIDAALPLSSCDILFPDATGKHRNSTALGDTLYQLTRKRGIVFNLYALRHQFSTDLILGGADIKTIQEIMGHKNQTMTIEYARSNDERKRAVLEKR